MKGRGAERRAGRGTAALRQTLARDPEGAVNALMARCRADPLAFVRAVFPWGSADLPDESGPDPWQCEVLEALGAASRGPHGAATSPGAALRRIAVSSGHGVGKTALVAWTVLWFLSTRAHPQIVVTANTQSQLSGKTWRELAKWHRLMLHRDRFQWTSTRLQLKASPQTWFAAATPWSAAQPEAFAGTHERDVLVVYDEASGIDDAIWDVTEGAMASPGAFWLAFGNPTRRDGRFAECFGRFRKRWRTLQVDARKSARADQGQIARWIEDYGEDSDFVRIRVRGVLPRATADQFIDEDHIQGALRRGAQGDAEADRDAPPVAGIDVARFGDDRSVALLRRGDRVLRIVRWRGLDTMQVAARVAELLAVWRPRTVFVDGVGVGGGVVDRLRQLGHAPVDVNGGARPSNPLRFVNLRAEMWSRVKDWLAAGAALPPDPELAADLRTPTYDFDGMGRLLLESKDDIKRRGSDSPDAGDALALTFAAAVSRRWPEGPGPRQAFADDRYDMFGPG